MAVDRDTKRIIRRNIRDPEKRQRYVDALLRHQIYSLRIGGASAQDAINRLKAVDAEVGRRIEALVSGGRPSPLRINALVKRLVSYTEAQLEAILTGLRQEWLEWAGYSLDRHGAELAALGISLQPAAKGVEAKIVMAALEHRMQDKNASSVGEMISRATTAHSQQVGQVVRRAWQEGATIADAKKSYKVLRIQRNNWVDTAVRTSLLSISNRARDAQLFQNRDIVPRVMWVSTLDSRTSSTCIWLDGQIFKQDKGPRPPAHPNCLPGDAFVTSCSGISAVSKRWFDGEMITVRTANGYEVTCTPNHPIFTNDGWKAAKSLDISSRVVCNLGRERPSVDVKAKDQQGISRIEDIVESFLGSRQALPMPVPIATEDFHGDGRQGEIAVIGTNRELRDQLNTPRSHHGPEFPLNVARVNASVLLGLGLLDFCLHKNLAAAGGRVGGLGKSFPLLRAGAIHSGLLLLRSIANMDSLFSQDTQDDIPAHGQAFADTLITDPLRVFLDDVVSVKVGNFRGHVYNLQTDDHCITANHIVTHNCRSVTIPLLPGETAADAIGVRPSVQAGPEFRYKRRESQAALQRRLRLEDGVRKPRKGDPTFRRGEIKDATYQDFLKRQPAAFQDFVLGVTRGRLFRSGKVSFDRFFDERGRYIPVKDLVETVKGLEGV